MKRLILFIMEFIMLTGVFNSVNAVSISNLSITDKLNYDLSMRETIIFNIINNTEHEFTLVLPDIAYDIKLNGSTIGNHSISEEISCELCSAKISYSFPNIITNDSENYTFYRKIDMPINISDFTYVIILPENHTLFNMSELRESILPNPTRIISDITFEWTYDAPRFPKEFAVRYKRNSIEEKHMFNQDNMLYSGIAIIIIIISLLGLIAGLIRLCKKRRKYNFN